MTPTLSELEILAQQAGAILRARYGSHHRVHHKSTLTDLVTETDQETEEFLLAHLRLRYPDHQLVAEESGQHGDNAQQSWYIDPLDGTVNFAHGIPIFSVSIAYAEQGKVKMGVVYDPMRDECFSAEQAKGAFLNGKRLQTTQVEELAQSLLVTGFPYDTWSTQQNNLENYARFALRSQGVRRLGSAALDLCYVAAGRVDGFWELRLSPWDIAAGGLIAEEAGARVTDIKGDPNYLIPVPSIIAANPTLHAQMLEILQTQPPVFNTR